MKFQPIVKAGLAALFVLGSMHAMANTLTLAPAITGFNKLDLQMDGGVVLSQEDKDRVFVDMDPKMKPYLRIYKTGQTLHLALKPHQGVTFSRKPVFVVTMRQIKAISDANGGAIGVVGNPIENNGIAISVKNSGRVAIPHLYVHGLAQIHLYNSGSIQLLDLQARQVGMTLKNSGRMHIHYLHALDAHTVIDNSGQVLIDSGFVKNQWIDVRHSGEYQAKNLVSLGANIQEHNSGIVSITANGPVSIVKHGSGRIYLYGHPIITSMADAHRSGVLLER